VRSPHRLVASSVCRIAEKKKKKATKMVGIFGIDC
jgi:hypothetical protein